MSETNEMNEITDTYYTISYSNTDINEVKYISNYINNNIKDILDYFMINTISNISIILYSNYNDFCNAYSKDKDIKPWIHAFAFNNIIHMLDLNTTINSTSHKNATLDYLSSAMLHEIVHIVHNTIERNNIGYNKKGYSYFREALACALGNKDFHKVIPMDISLNELTSGKIYNYDYYYTLGKYIIDNIPHEKVLEYVKNPSLLDEDINDIYDKL